MPLPDRSPPAESQRFRILIRSALPDRLVFDTENISTMWYFLMPLFSPGDMQSIYFFERESQDVWCYYSIVRTIKNASPLTAGNKASAINVAMVGKYALAEYLCQGAINIYLVIIRTGER